MNEKVKESNSKVQECPQQAGRLESLENEAATELQTRNCNKISTNAFIKI